MIEEAKKLTIEDLHRIKEMLEGVNWNPKRKLLSSSDLRESKLADDFTVRPFIGPFDNSLDIIEGGDPEEGKNKMNYGVCVEIKDETVERIPKPRVDILIKIDGITYTYSLNEFKCILRHYEHTSGTYRQGQK